MNYSTIKKTAVAATLVAALGFADTAQAQQVFGGRSQYRTWSIGVQGGITTPNNVLGGTNAFGQKVGYFQNKVGEYYGLTVRKQFSHLFGLEVEANRGKIKTYNHDLSGPAIENSRGARSVETKVNWAASLNGVFQLGTIDFLRRENAVNFYAKVGLGAMAYNPVQYSNNDFSGTVVYDNSGKWGEGIIGDRDKNDEGRDNKLTAFVPVGVGAKFKLSEVVALNLGYTMNFADDQIYGPARQSSYKGKFSQVMAGLEFTLGSKDKQNLTFANPVATMYDELKDPSLRNEVEALKQRVSTLEGTVNTLSADADGDGVSDKFDKCPDTPAGTPVDGSGCPIKFPEPQVLDNNANGYYAPIQFEFDSSVLKTSSYSTLDKLAKEVRDNNSTVTLDGYASEEGSEAYNMTLSKDRANSVKQYLVNAGVSASSITANGYGEANPVASNATEEGRIQNRRVEIKK
ncbi:OmpA family protein [Sphingobacterium sp. N143]|uniref:OmpA family protein n=1 Tax=Sphingobacterium sp. N143 TaxID=2746727 RepID=UPI002576907A|nr:OmpA family protein [Sphingobacterium sp. N143]MDM1296791.1 OmpA family protein [Sphingobacterium sp. N143]